MAYDAASQLVTMLQGQATTTYTFDQNGNQVTENNAGVIIGYVYDQENRLIKQIASDGSNATYAYSGDGLRRSRQESDGVIHTQIWVDGDYLGEQ